MGELVDYADGTQPLQGYLARAHGVGPHPGVFIVHTWLGLTESIKGRADRLATAGFTALALDVFGPGVLHRPPETARAVVTPFLADRERYRGRLRAGVAALRAVSGVDTGRIGGVGYCFGGFGVLELARDGLDFQAAVALHAELKTATPMRVGEVRPRLLLLHGDGDPVAPKGDLAPFLDELRSAGADWELGLYAGARHSFTGEGAWGDALPEARLDPYAEARSWASTVHFLRRVLQADGAGAGGGT
jgi:dienelactone hydrolase